MRHVPRLLAITASARASNLFWDRRHSQSPTQASQLRLPPENPSGLDWRGYCDDRTVTANAEGLWRRIAIRMERSVLRRCERVSLDSFPASVPPRLQCAARPEQRDDGEATVREAFASGCTQ
jgi:hypothetical protein